MTERPDNETAHFLTDMVIALGLYYATAESYFDACEAASKAATHDTVNRVAHAGRLWRKQAKLVEAVIARTPEAIRQDILLAGAPAPMGNNPISS